MKMSFLIVFCVFATLQASAFPIGEIAYSVQVLDERTGEPIENVPVKGMFTDIPISWGGDGAERVVQRLTDAQGLCRFTGTSNHGTSYYVVEQLPGYYKVPTVKYTAANQKRNFLPYRCEPYDCVFTTVLQRIEHPIPLYVRKAEARDKNGRLGGFDGTNAVLRFDFVIGDWLPPQGKGKQADMIIYTEYKFRERYDDGDSCVVQKFFDFRNSIEFPGNGNGFCEKSFADVSLGIKFREAPADGYEPRKTLRFGRRRKKTNISGVWPEVFTESDERRCYCIRIRSKFNEKGTLVEAYYGKVYGDFNFEGWEDPGFIGVTFLYYLNPTSLDRNLEWDMKNNLCPDSGRIVSIEP